MFKDNDQLISYIAANQHLLSEGFPCPPVPHHHAQKLHSCGHHSYFTTEPSLPALYHHNYYFQSLLSGTATELSAFGVSGHGFNTSAMHFYLVDGPLAVLLQDPIPLEPDHWCEKLQEEYQAISVLAIICEDALHQGVIKEGEKLVICRSLTQTPQWGILTSSGSKQQWHNHSDPLQEALSWLSGALK
ncbi:hypothetical protein ACH42_04955 [Endozoicomonas sp. (ex Bugula neritina AB1)]|nr:hypothetical protein ACH42_04955 [Endozoicomonas sp. (ex Bugula neritina AB1)]